MSHSTAGRQGAATDAERLDDPQNSAGDLVKGRLLDRAQAETHLDALFGGQRGDVLISLGRSRQRNKASGKYEHKRWDDAIRYGWPEDRELLLTEVGQFMREEPTDVYIVP